MINRAIEVLEFNKVKDMLAGYASSELAKQQIHELMPMSNERMICDALTETTEAVSVILYKGIIPLSEMNDISQAVNMAVKGRVLSMSELLMIKQSLAVTRKVKTFLSTDIPEIPVISEITSLIEPLTTLFNDIKNSILSDDEIADSASSELRHIRKEIKTKNIAIKNKLAKLISSPQFQSYLQDPIVTIRDDRYVLPVKRECSAMIQGIVHDSSQTGATLFIEPRSVFDMNNELRELQIKEKKEIDRILAALSAEVASARYQLINNQELLVKLDVISAKGRLSQAMGAIEPNINGDGIIDIRCARHPLISPENVVPIDVSLGDNFSILLITGPNTGGKTVTLKTIGIFVLMAEAGLHLPCDECSIPVIKEVYADIGDEQSIEQSLSTFSSHMRNIVNIFDNVTDSSLVLLDELGAGTDPDEGAALGIAELERLKSTGALVAATTHYTELKKYALSTDGVENASMEFDLDTLSPTYKLRIGLPGKSNAFEISRKLGLDESIISRAAELLDENEVNLSKAISRIEESRALAENILNSSTDKMNEAKELRTKATEELEKAKEERLKILKSSEEEASSILRKAQITADEVSAELKELRRSMRKSGKTDVAIGQISSSKRRIKEIEACYNSGSGSQISTGNAPSREMLSAGMRVKLTTIDQNGVVESLPDAAGNLTVRVGALKISCNISELIIIESEPQGNRIKRRREYSRLRSFKAGNIGISLNLIGKSLDEALIEMEKYIDDACLAGLKSVTIIHGRGEGILRDGLRKKLKHTAAVKSYRSAPYNEGGDGATIVELKDKR